MAKKKTGVELAALIHSLRQELNQAVREGEGDEIRFKLENVELELQMTVGLAAEGKGGIKMWLVEAGGNAKAAATESSASS